MSELETLNQVLLADQLRQRYKKASHPFEQPTGVNKQSLDKPSYKTTEFKQGITKPCLNRLPKEEFHRIASQLTRWGVSNSGAVIARENPWLVKQAVDITLSSLREIRITPKKYFRGVLRNLQEQKQAS